MSYFRFRTDVANPREELQAVGGAAFFKCEFLRFRSVRRPTRMDFFGGNGRIVTRIIISFLIANAWLKSEFLVRRNGVKWVRCQTMFFHKIIGHDVLSRVCCYDVYSVRVVLHFRNLSIEVSSLSLCLPNLSLPMLYSHSNASWFTVWHKNVCKW